MRKRSRRKQAESAGLSPAVIWPWAPGFGTQASFSLSKWANTQVSALSCKTRTAQLLCGLRDLSKAQEHTQDNGLKTAKWLLTPHMSHKRNSQERWVQLWWELKDNPNQLLSNNRTPKMKPGSGVPFFRVIPAKRHTVSSAQMWSLRLREIGPHSRKCT